MGYYSEIIGLDPVETVLSKEEFCAKWEQAIKATEGTTKEGYLDIYSWDIEHKENGKLWFALGTTDGSLEAKHYADRELAQFISSVIADGRFCILEFDGEDGERWGYYITVAVVKDIEYVRMVDGKPF
jgi:hypothetical protein